MTALALMRLLPSAATVVGGTALLDGRDILALGRREMRSVRGDEVSMVFQEPMTSLDPAFTIGDQIVETIKAHSSDEHERGPRARDRDARSGSASRTPRAASTTTRTSSRAGCASG